MFGQICVFEIMVTQVAILFFLSSRMTYNFFLLYYRYGNIPDEWEVPKPKPFKDVVIILFSSECVTLTLKDT